MDMVTFRKGKLTLESIVWLLVDIAIYKDKSMADIVNQRYIVDQTGKPFIVSIALTQGRKI
jgi:hypothetical protein|tara:strand:- start:312 stop:494 length:183 start_codon:yes stop_codon:yes gene_type:complete